MCLEDVGRLSEGCRKAAFRMWEAIWRVWGSCLKQSCLQGVGSLSRKFVETV